jgi:hypothetical protein
MRVREQLVHRRRRPHQYGAGLVARPDLEHLGQLVGLQKVSKRPAEASFRLGIAQRHKPLGLNRPGIAGGPNS